MRRNPTNRTALTVLACLMGGNLFAGQIAVNWIGPSGTGGSGNWSTATDWSGGVSPNNGGGTTYGVTISNSPNGDLVTLDVSPTVDTLTLGSLATLATNGGTTLTTGALTVNANGNFYLNNGAALSVSGDVSNSGVLITNENNGGGVNTIAIGGTLTNTSTGTLTLGNVDNTTDTLTAVSLNNAGTLAIGHGATLSLTNGVTNVVAGSSYDIRGSFTAGASSGVATLNSIEGQIFLSNGQTTSTTPGSGTLTISSTGILDAENSSTATVNGDVSNSGTLETNRFNRGGGTTVTITGALTNNANGNVVVGNVNNTTDVMNVGSLNNNGSLIIGHGATLNLTNQPAGITDVAAGSSYDIQGNFNAGGGSAVRNLASVEGQIFLSSGQTYSITPGGGVLAISGSGILDAENSSTLTVIGDVNNSGTLETNRFNRGGGTTVSITGTLTNNASGNVVVGNVNNTTDVMNVGTLSNSGSLTIGKGATLNLTSQSTGITDVAAGSSYDIQGNFNAGGGSALRNLTTVEGQIFISNGQTVSITPGSGALTISNAGILDAENSSTVTINGNLANFGTFETNRFNRGGGTTVNITGALTNNSSGTVVVGNVNNTTDVVNAGSLINNGDLIIGHGATLNLTTQSSGITDVAAGSTYDIQGSFTAGGSSAVRNLTAVEGQIFMSNGQTTAITPGGGTLTVSSTGILDAENSSTLTLNGDLNNSGIFETNRFNRGGGTSVTITGALINNASGSVVVGNVNNTTDVVNAGTLTNNGSLIVGRGATLNLTTQTGGITNVAAGSTYDLQGSFTAGGGSALRNLASIDGQLLVRNGQSTTITPGGGTLTVSSAGILDAESSSTVTVSGNVNNSGMVETNRLNGGGGTTLSVTGAFTNNSIGTLLIGNVNNTTDVANLGTLLNSGTVDVLQGATLNLTGATISTNSSDIVLNGGTLTVAGELDNTGTVESTGTELVASSFDGSDFMNLSGGVFDLNKAGDSAEFATFGNGGTANTVQNTLLAVGSGTPDAATGLDVRANGVYDEQIGGNASFGVLTVAGPALLNGTLDVSLLNSFLPGVGSTFTFLNFTPGDLTGTFSSIEGDVFNNGTEAWTVLYNNAQGNLELEAISNQGSSAPEPSTMLLVGGVLVFAGTVRRQARKRVR